jgi:hypothetical protein
LTNSRPNFPVNEKLLMAIEVMKHGRERKLVYIGSLLDGDSIFQHSLVTTNWRRKSVTETEK